MEDALYHQSWSSDGYLHKEILAMPNFVESEGDVEKLAKEIHKSTHNTKIIRDGFFSYEMKTPYEEMKQACEAQAQAAINALKIKGER
jgi:ATP-dependent RNA circularization protein (DNA/RNA ligase family)